MISLAVLGWGGTNIFGSCAEVFEATQSQEMPLCRDRQAGKIEFMGVYFTHTGPSEFQLEPGEVEIPCALDAKLVMLVCETEPAPSFLSCSSVFLQDTVASEGPDHQVLVISSDWLAGEGCCKYFLFQAVLQLKGV